MAEGCRCERCALVGCNNQRAVIFCLLTMYDGKKKKKDKRKKDGSASNATSSVGDAAAPSIISPDNMSLCTRALVADRDVEPSLSDVAPPIHVSTMYEYATDQGNVYARYEQPTRRRVETVLGSLEGGCALAYSSGLAAIGAVFQYLLPL